MTCLRAVISFVLLAAAGGCGRAGMDQASPPPQAAEDPQAAGVADTLGQYRQASGGDAWAGVKGLRAVGSSFGGGSPTGRRLVIQAAHPFKFRQYEGPLNPRNPAPVSIVVFDGESGWREGQGVLAGEGASADPAVRERAQTLAARQALVNAVAGIAPAWLVDSKALTFRYVGRVTSGPDRDGTAVAIDAPNGPVGQLIFDGKTHLPRRMLTEYLRPIRPEGGSYSIAYSDFRPVKGVQLPFRFVRENEAGARVTWVVTRYELNPVFQPLAFARADR